MSRPHRAVFRLPLVSVVFPVLLFVCVTPLATVRPYFLPLYLIPVLALVYILVTRSSADAEAITAIGPSGVRRIPWADLDGFEFHGPRWAIAVTLDGKRFRLPMIRPRDLPRLAAVSGGRLTLGGPPAADPRPADVDPADVDPADLDPADLDPVHAAGVARAVDVSEPPADDGLEPPADDGLEPPAADGLEPPAADGLETGARAREAGPDRS